jgi:hypothetical protein
VTCPGFGDAHFFHCTPPLHPIDFNCAILAG